MRVAALIVIGGCAGTTKHGDVGSRIPLANAVGFSATLEPGLFYGGLWFDDPACQQQFVAPGVIAKEQIAGFASCLAGLHLRTSDRHHPYDDVVELEYAPGFEVEAQLDGGGAITWIGYAGRLDLRDALPSVTPAALEALRTSGAATPSLDDHAQARLRAERAELGVATSYVWLKLCLDTEGRVTGAHPREESSPVAAEVFSAAVSARTFKPFVVGGRAIPVCAMLHVADPATDHDLVLPEPVPEELGSVVVPTKSLHRVSGRTQLMPPEEEAVEITRLGVHRLIGSFAYCIDEHGAVTKVVKVRPTGLVRYDRLLADAIHGWTYKPFVVEGTARPACAGIKFIYTQSY